MISQLLWLLTLVAGFQPLPATAPECQSAVCSQLADVSSQQGPAEAEEDNPAHASLLQTSLHVEPLRPARAKTLSLLNANRTEHAHKIHRAMVQNKMFTFDKDECSPVWPLDTELKLSLLQDVANLPAPKVCRSALLPVLLSTNASAADRQVTHGQDSLNMSTTMWVLVVYGVVVFLSVLCMLRNMYSSPDLGKQVETGKRAELEAWNHGLLSWFCISWATPWIQRWGNDNSDKVKIKASELGQVGTPEDECKNAIKTFAKIWAEHSEKKEKNPLLWTLFYFIGAKKIFAAIFAGFVYECLMYVGPVLTVWWALNTANEYYEQLAAGVELTMEDYLPTVISLVSMFTSMPLIMTCFNTFMHLLCCRINLRMQAALATAIYLKGLRLPAGLKKLDLRDEATKENDAKEQKDNAPKEGLDDAEILSGQQHNVQDYSIVALVSTDVNLQLVEMARSGMVVLTTTPIILMLIVLMLIRLKAATLFALGSLATVISVWIFCAIAMVTGLIKCQYASGSRVAFFQEIMFGIRVVKAYAWEDAVKDRINVIRTQEMSHLLKFWRWLGGNIATMLAMPKIAIIASLYGYVLCYGSMGPSDIFVIIQILNAFQAAATIWSISIPQLAAVGPALGRIERFLQTEEADIPALKERPFMPEWATSWPKEFVAGSKLPELQLKGSFSWLKGHEAVLHDLDFCVASGEKVAVIGEVGAGKTTFLQALSGELYPVGQDARLCIPSKIAYHSQVPYIIEGTLKENVLFYQVCDDNLYNRAIHAACLLKDLEVLPGGDSVPIGSRGISLSGGQRARVSVARTAYCQNAKVVLLDDPLASLDGPTGNHIVENMFKGPILEGRTVVCVCQPHAEILEHFDRVFVMRDGRIEARGTPTEIVKSDAFMRLMSQNDSNINGVTPSLPLEDQTKTAEIIPASPTTETREPAGQFREEESEGRFDYATLKYFIIMGGWKRLFIAFLFYIIMIVCQLLAEITLAGWANEVIYRNAAIENDPEHLADYSFTPAWQFLVRCAAWTAIGVFLFAWSWYASTTFIMTIAEGLHRKMLDSLMRAPIDRFYDKTPVGRILNRMSSDLSNLDQKMYTQMTSTTSQVFWVSIPVIYIHMVMPLIFTVFSLPIWFVMILSFRKYINVVVPLRYLSNVSRSEVNVYISEVDNSKTTLRAFQVHEHVAAEQCGVMDNLLKAQFAGDCVKRWVLNRLTFLWAVWVTLIAICSMLNLEYVSVGTMSVCLTSALLSLMKLDWILDMMTYLQFEFVCMNRLYEYLELPQERSFELHSDGKLSMLTATFPRSHTRLACKLEVREGETGVQVWRVIGDKQQIIMDQEDDTLRVANEAALELMRKMRGLEQMQLSHRIVSVNNAHKNAKQLAEVYAYGKTDKIQLRLESSWLQGGARLQITDLVAGYADSPSNVLKGINVTIEPKTKTAIVGTTGCGKSTMILCLLRVLEPRAGRILVNGVDIQDIGLKTLRTNLGLVPQDPFVFSGTIRSNLDPFSEFTDSCLWNALKAVQMSDFIEKLEKGLNHVCSTDGSNLSFGQRQLLCMARMIVRQPSLLLLDECTSAIDPRTQELVQEAIRSCFPESTLLVIAHRLETILDFDMAIVLERGRVVEKGSIKALASQTGGIFATMLAAR